MNLLSSNTVLIGVLLLGLSAAACQGVPDAGEPALTAEPSILGYAPMNTIKKLVSGNKLNICLYGADLTASNIPTRKTWIRTAVMAWVDAARAATSLTLIKSTDIVFVATGPKYSKCTAAYDVEVNWAADDGRGYGSPNGWIVLYHNNEYYNVLHEFGHVFGLNDIYIEDVWTCLPGQEGTVMCTMDSTLWPEDINAIGEILCMAYPQSCKRRWESNMKWCYGSTTAQLLVGDFNGDKRSDMLCHEPANGYKWISYANTSGKFTGSTWSADMKWCTGANLTLRLGDFNGDGRTDMLCHNTATGYKQIAYANTSGAFTGTGWSSDMKWCYGPTAQLLVADFNNDKRADMLCHETSNGYKWIAYADSAGKFTGTGWEANLGWCYGIAAAQLLLGDFNGDKRADMLCHDPNTGYKWIALADTNGRFTGTSWESDMGWCGTDAQLLLGDFNGDGRTDMLCHRLSDGHKWIAFAAVDGTFPGTSRDWPMDWCAQPDLSVLKSMRIADFDGNGTSDFLCHDASNGYKWIAYQFKQ